MKKLHLALTMLIMAILFAFTIQAQDTVKEVKIKVVKEVDGVQVVVDTLINGHVDIDKIMDEIRMKIDIDGLDEKIKVFENIEISIDSIAGDNISKRIRISMDGVEKELEEVEKELEGIEKEIKVIVQIDEDGETKSNVWTHHEGEEVVVIVEDGEGEHKNIEIIKGDGGEHKIIKKVKKVKGGDQYSYEMEIISDDEENNVFIVDGDMEMMTILMSDLNEEDEEKIKAMGIEIPKKEIKQVDVFIEKENDNGFEIGIKTDSDKEIELSIFSKDGKLIKEIKDSMKDGQFKHFIKMKDGEYVLKIKQGKRGKVMRMILN